MLFRKAVLAGIQDGSVTLAFRRWRRPSVRPGGTLLTPVGELSIGSVTRVDADAITDADARRAGYPSGDALLHELGLRSEGEVFRIELGPLRADPRIALRERDRLTDRERRELHARLQRLDARAAAGAWTRPTLELIERRPAVRAGDLCVELGMEKEAFKLNVRKLKNLGLTESLGTGYSLSPRGAALLQTLRAAEAVG